MRCGRQFASATGSLPDVHFASVVAGAPRSRDAAFACGTPAHSAARRAAELSAPPTHPPPTHRGGAAAYRANKKSHIPCMSSKAVQMLLEAPAPATGGSPRWLRVPTPLPVATAAAAAPCATASANREEAEPPEECVECVVEAGGRAAEAGGVVADAAGVHAKGGVDAAGAAAPAAAPAATRSRSRRFHSAPPASVTNSDTRHSCKVPPPMLSSSEQLANRNGSLGSEECHAKSATGERWPA
jgi:hypothetical protein